VNKDSVHQAANEWQNVFWQNFTIRSHLLTLCITQTFNEQFNLKHLLIFINVSKILLCSCHELVYSECMLKAHYARIVP